MGQYLAVVQEIVPRKASLCIYSSFPSVPACLYATSIPPLVFFLTHYHVVHLSTSPLRYFLPAFALPLSPSSFLSHGLLSESTGNRTKAPEVNEVEQKRCVRVECCPTPLGGSLSVMSFCCSYVHVHWYSAVVRGGPNCVVVIYVVQKSMLFVSHCCLARLVFLQYKGYCVACTSTCAWIINLHGL